MAIFPEFDQLRFIFGWTILIQISYLMSGEELEEISFPNEELEKIIHETIEAELGTKNYEEKEVPHWINRIN